MESNGFLVFLGELTVGCTRVNLANSWSVDVRNTVCVSLPPSVPDHGVNFRALRDYRSETVGSLFGPDNRWQLCLLRVPIVLFGFYATEVEDCYTAFVSSTTETDRFVIGKHSVGRDLSSISE